VGRTRVAVANQTCFLGGLLEEPYNKEGTILRWSRQFTLYVRSPRAIINTVLEGTYGLTL
jgi:hypothetical protein